MGWQVPEFERHARGRSWYLLMGLIALLLVGYAMATANFLFAIIVILFAVVVVLHGRLEPPAVEVALHEFGIALNHRFYGWSDVVAFWIAYEPPAVKKLYLDFSGFRPRLTVSLAEADPVRVREILGKYCKEDLKKEGEPASELLARILKL